MWRKCGIFCEKSACVRRGGLTISMVSVADRHLMIATRVRTHHHSQNRYHKIYGSHRNCYFRYIKQICEINLWNKKRWSTRLETVSCFWGVSSHVWSVCSQCIKYFSACVCVGWSIYQKSLLQMLAMICHCEICNISTSRTADPANISLVYHKDSLHYVCLFACILSTRKIYPLSFPQEHTNTYMHTRYIGLILMAEKASVKIHGLHNI